MLVRSSGGATFYFNNDGEYEAARYGIREAGRYADFSRQSFFEDEEFGKNNCSIPQTVDRKSFRSFIGVNGLIPGPTLIVREGQTVAVNIINRLTSEGISVHWHGIHQIRTPWMDGVGLISQCPIKAGSSFRYIFRATPAGTHWYHSHTGAQRTDGLFGALIAKENDTNLMSVRDTLGSDLRSFVDQPDNHTLTLLDWQQESSLDLFAQIHSTLGFYTDRPAFDIPNGTYTPYRRTVSPDTVEVGPVPYWSGLINGRGRHSLPDTAVDYAMTRLSIFDVDPDMLYRFRLIGAQSLYAYKFSIDGHKLIVIATDGVFIEPQTVDFIIIHSGERYDFLLNTTQTAANYWIRAETLEVTPDRTQFLNHTAEAILHYNTTSRPQPQDGYSTVTSTATQCSPANNCTAINCPFENFPAEFAIDCIHLHNL